MGGHSATFLPPTSHHHHSIKHLILLVLSQVHYYFYYTTWRISRFWVFAGIIMMCKIKGDFPTDDHLPELNSLWQWLVAVQRISVLWRWTAAGKERHVIIINILKLAGWLAGHVASVGPYRTTESTSPASCTAVQSDKYEDCVHCKP